MNIASVKNIGSFIDNKLASDPSAATAGGTGDATTVTGIAIDREAFGTGAIPRSMLASVLYEATLGSGKTLSMGYAVQDSADNSTWADFQTAAGVVIATGPSGGGAAKGTFNVPVDLSNAREWVRFNYFPDLSATATDTFVGQAVGTFGGFDRNPAPTT